MIYTEMTKKALKVSFDAHKEQPDKNGIPYVYHPFHVAEQMDTEAETIVALLHDVIEDSDRYTLQGIKEMGFSDEVIEALALMTHEDSVPYMEYVAKLKPNPIARKVKLADLRHNSDLSRLDIIEDEAVKRLKKYKEAYEYLIK